jgi:hypothetical protein
MPKSPIDDWLAVQEHKRAHAIFLIEWLSLFALAWMFWSVMFFSAPGSVPPGLAATLVAGLYATCMIYGRLLRATGCKKCNSPLPFLRKEIGRRHMRDEEDCLEIQYGAEEYGQHTVQVYCRIMRNDVVSYRCRHCDQVWEEKVQLPGTGYKLVRRVDVDESNK